VAAQAKRDEEMRLLLMTEEREKRWTKYLRVADCTPWPGITDAEREFVAAAAAEKDSPLRDISDDELGRAAAIVRQEFAAKRKQLSDFLDLFDQMIAVSNELRGNYSTAFLREGKGMQPGASVADLHSLHKATQEFYDRLRQYFGPPEAGLSPENF
jgi:hypothetical protein